MLILICRNLRKKDVISISKKKSLCLPLLFRNESIRKIRRQLRIEQRGTTASKQGGWKNRNGRISERSEAERVLGDGSVWCIAAFRR